LAEIKIDHLYVFAKCFFGSGALQWRLLIDVSLSESGNYEKPTFVWWIVPQSLHSYEKLHL